MRIVFLKFIYLASIFLTLHGLVFAVCELNPFPPYPPSPGEFKSVPKVTSSESGIVLSWEEVRNRDGYVVSVCTADSNRFEPISRTDSTSITVGYDDLPEKVWFQVRAFVYVDDSYVFNGGRVVSVNIGSNEKSKRIDKSRRDGDGKSFDEPSGSEVELQVGESVSLTDVRKLQSEFPEFNGSASFYNPNFPQVVNPFVPTTRGDGSIIPALLTDEGITETVERVRLIQAQRDKQSRNNQPAKVVVTEGVSSSSSVGPDVSKGEVEKSLSTSTNTSLHDDSVGTQMSSQIGEGRVHPSENMSKEIESPESEHPGAQIHIYILVGFLVLSFIYLIFYKESK